MATCGFLRRDDVAPVSRRSAIHVLLCQDVNLHFDPSWEAQLSSRFGSVKHPFWIKQGDRRTGGVQIGPNEIGDLFLIPPFSDTYKVLSLLKAILVHWSDSQKEIRAYPVFPDQKEPYYMLGFSFHRSSRSMVRPTEALPVTWDDAFDVSSPRKGQEDEIAQLLCEAQLARGITFSLEGQTRKMATCIDGFSLPEAVRRASSTVHDKHSGRLVGACIIALRYRYSWPMVFDIAVHPDFQRRGLATRMLKRALTALKEGGYPALTLDVSTSNSAQSVYANLGFLPGVEVSTFRIPAAQSRK